MKAATSPIADRGVETLEGKSVSEVYGTSLQFILFSGKQLYAIRLAKALSGKFWLLIYVMGICMCNGVWQKLQFKIVML